MAPRPKDVVDEIVDQWKRHRPDLDLRPMAIVGRIGRLATLGERLVSAALERHGLAIGEFDVLAALRRAGVPYRLTPTQLSRTLMLSSGAMTNRLDRLERAGLVERLPDPDDRRGVLVSLTKSGLARVDAAVTDHVANEAEILSPLTLAEQAELAKLLRKWLIGLESKER